MDFRSIPRFNSFDTLTHSPLTTIDDGPTPDNSAGRTRGYLFPFSSVFYTRLLLFLPVCRMPIVAMDPE